MRVHTHAHTDDALSNQASGPLQTLVVCHRVTLNKAASCSYPLNRVLNNSALSPRKTMTQLNQSASIG